MKILQISGTYFRAQEKIIYSIHDFLRKNGHESYVLYSYGNSDDPHIIKYETKWANSIRRILRKYVTTSPHCAFLATLQLLKKINKIKPDIVHLHILHNGYIDYILLFKYLAKKKIPVVYTMHDMWEFSGGCYYYTDIHCNGYTENCQNCPKDKSRLDCNPKKTSHYLNIKMNLFRCLKKIVFVGVSDWICQEAKKSKLNDYPIYTVWNALNSDIYKTFDQTNLENNHPSLSSDELFKIIGVANCWTARKGIHLFFKLADILGEDYKILLVGKASKQLQEEAPSNISFLGSINDKMELAKYYAQANIHISMSTEETFGFTFVEAALAGTKSIGFNSTAIPSVINKIKGFVVPPNNVQAVVDQVIKLNKNRQLCKLNKTERKEIYKEFSPEKMAQDYYQIYSSILKGLPVCIIKY